MTPIEAAQDLRESVNDKMDIIEISDVVQSMMNPMMDVVMSFR